MKQWQWYSSSELEGGQLATNYTSLFTVSIMPSSLHIEFYKLYRSIYTTNAVLTADPDLNVIIWRWRQRYIEPRWWVEGTTRASGTTPLSVPQGIASWPENAISAIPLNQAWLTEVVLTHMKEYCFHQCSQWHRDMLHLARGWYNSSKGMIQL